MNKFSVDGLLILKPDQIKIIYWRCWGETVEATAKKLNMGPSTVYKELKEEIYPLLGVQGWDDIKATLCRHLLLMVTKPEELDNWPEGFREKIEALRETVEASKETQRDSLRARWERVRNRYPRWFVVAIPMLIFCLLCIGGITFAGPPIQTMIVNALATNTPGVQVQVTQELIETTSPSFTETSVPTHTPTPEDTSTPTNTPPPTDTLVPTPTPLFFDDFTGDMNDVWRSPVYGDVPFGAEGGLKFRSRTMVIIGDSSWTDYEISFDVWGIYCQAQGFSDGITTGLRVQDASNMMALEWVHWRTSCVPSWYLMQNGNEEMVFDHAFPLPPKDSQGKRHFVVKVQGSTYNTPFGGEITIDNFPSGGVAVIADNNVIIDNFKVISLSP